jgi:uncharacterized protein
MTAPARTRDVTEVIIGFAHTLRHAGVDAGPERVQAMLTALGHLDVLDPEQVYWAGRLTLCGDPDDLQRYDATFAVYFGSGSGRSPERLAAPPPRQVLIAPLTEPPPPAEGGEPEPVPPLAVRASGQEVLRRRDIAVLSAADRAELNRLFALLSPRIGRRRTHRYARANRGRIDLARTVRQLLRDGGEPSRLARQTRRTKPRRLVLLVDVSGSMGPYADALLRFAHAAARANPATTEVFTIGTRLTRITRELAQRDPDRALNDAGEAIADWSGGTRIGEVLRAFLDRWGQRGAARGAIVVVFSDGWERGDSGLLAEQMARLAGLAHRVVWVNPHKGKDGFAPATAGMQAALPYIDQLVAGHTFAALEELVAVIAGA